jgi:hypothetical protein
LSKNKIKKLRVRTWKQISDGFSNEKNDYDKIAKLKLSFLLPQRGKFDEQKKQFVITIFNKLLLYVRSLIEEENKFTEIKKFKQIKSINLTKLKQFIEYYG